MANPQRGDGSPVLEVSRGAPLPAETVLAKVGIVGMSGSGKTQTARKLAETMLHAEQHIGVLDPTGAWWGLRSSANGLKPGYPVVVFGGKRKDVKLDAGSGIMLARAFVKERFNAIFDMSAFNDADIRTFSTDFLNEVYRANRYPVHLFMDEFDIICPQAKSAKSEEARDACNTVVRRGRLKGIGATMITQNPQDADKSVLNMADIVIAMRTGGAQAIDAIGKWMGRNLGAPALKEMLTSLPTLETGKGWLWAPQLNRFGVEHFRLCKTFDSSKTPKMGEKIVPPKVLAKVDIEKLGKDIAASVQEAKEESPEYWKQRVRELESKPVTTENVEKIMDLMQEIERLKAKAAESDKLREEVAILSHDVQAAEKRSDIAMRFFADAAALLAMAKEELTGVASAPIVMPLTTVRNVPAAPPEAIGRTIIQTPRQASPAAISGGVQDRILSALAQFNAIGVPAPDRMLVGMFAGYSNTASKGFANAMGAMRSSGLIDYPGDGKVSLTDEGAKIAPRVDAAIDNKALHQMIYGMLDGPQERILKTLISLYPHTCEREVLAAEVGYGNMASKGFANSIGRLSSLGFIRYPGKGLVVATELCFLPRRG